MSARQYSFGTSGNPLVQALWMLVGIVVLAAAVVMGAVVLAVLLGLGVVAAAVLAIRVWWLRRKLERGGGFAAAGGDTAERPPEPRLIEAEYTVVAERDARDRSDAPDRDDRGAPQ